MIILKKFIVFSLDSLSSSKAFLLLNVVETKKGVSYLTKEVFCGIEFGFSS
jgi:hypothetical protein